MSDDTDLQSRIALITIGSALTGAGIGIVSPGLKDAVLAEINQRFHLDLYLNAPPWAGALLIVAGVLMLLMAFIGQGRLERTAVRLFDGRGSSIGTFLAIKHVGFDPVVRDLHSNELPNEMRRRNLLHLQIDLSHELRGAHPQVETALAKQLRLPDQITAVLGVNPTADLGYCGIVQAPFQLLAGFQLASWLQLRSFEWHRHDHKWVALTSGTGADLSITSSTEVLGTGAHLAIAVEVSYVIAASEIAASVPDAGQLIRIAVAAPALDCVTHEGQVAELARQFRIALDGARMLPPTACTHVFCSAPVSVGFALGRMISRTLHPPVRVYAYDRNGPKPYPWGVEVNGTPGPSQVVRN